MSIGWLACTSSPPSPEGCWQLRYVERRAVAYGPFRSLSSRPYDGSTSSLSTTRAGAVRSLCAPSQVRYAEDVLRRVHLPFVAAVILAAVYVLTAQSPSSADARRSSVSVEETTVLHGEPDTGGEPGVSPAPAVNRPPGVSAVFDERRSPSRILNQIPRWSPRPPPVLS
jgi:hypothetical protein